MKGPLKFFLKLVAICPLFTILISPENPYVWLGLLFPESVLSLFTGFAQATGPPDPFGCWDGWPAHPCAWEPCWDNLASLVTEDGPGVLMLDGEAGPVLGFTTDFSLSFLLFLHTTSSPGCASREESSCCCSLVLLPPPLPVLDSLCGKWTLILLFSLLEADPRCSDLCKAYDSVSISFISLCLLLWPTATCLGDVTVLAVAWLEKESALLASRKSVSGNAIFKISKKRSWTFLASVLTCEKQYFQHPSNIWYGKF